MKTNISHLSNIASILSAQGYSVSVEVPHLELRSPAMPKGWFLAIGMTDDHLDYDLINADGNVVAFSPPQPIVPVNAAYHAAVIRDWVSSEPWALANDRLFSCTAEWCCGTRNRILSDLAENVRDDEVLHSLRTCRIGDTVTSLEPFNGLEYFTRIA